MREYTACTLGFLLGACAGVGTIFVTAYVVANTNPSLLYPVLLLGFVLGPALGVAVGGYYGCRKALGYAGAKDAQDTAILAGRLGAVLISLVLIGSLRQRWPQPLTLLIISLVLIIVPSLARWLSLHQHTHKNSHQKSNDRFRDGH